jgi:4-hydroxy-2-oxoheptanedioate aldolase
MSTNVQENRAKRRLAAGELVLCMGVNQMRTPNIAMIAAACGFDAVYIDLEHNPTSLESAAAICVAALALGITPIARVTSHDAHDATRILDSGAQGVMVPHVSTVAEAKAVVEACLYAPLGHRSAFGSGPALGYAATPQAEVCRILNEQTLLMAMIETPEAVANAAAMAAVPGIDVLHIGASDLSTEMGIPGQYKHERMRAAFETVAKAARAHGKAMGVGGVREDLEFQTWLIGLGMRYLTGGSDVGYILSAGRADVKRLRAVAGSAG